VTGWDIHPDGVQAVVTRVGTHTQTLSTAAKSFATNIQAAAQASGSSVVANALNDFLTHRAAELTGLGTLIESAETGAVNATIAYLKGDEQMAANAQAAAAAAAGTAPPVTVRGPR
jgi:hypothetical protein